MKLTGLLFFSGLAILGCKQETEYDLLIYNAKVLDVKTGTIARNKSIWIKDGKIKTLTDTSETFVATQTINANHKLVTPGLIDTHIHPTDVFGDREKAPVFLNKDSLNSYRQDLSNAYLPFGITTTLIMGQPENWLPPILEWQKKPEPFFTDFFTCGGALISKENRVPYIAHCVVATPAAAREKVIAYYHRGIRHIKLYARLNAPEFEAAYKTADSLKMKIFGHIGEFGLAHLKIDHTLKSGLINYEHLATIPNNILVEQKDWDALDKQFEKHFGAIDTEAKVLEYFLEAFRFVDENRKQETETLISRLAENKATFSTTIHYLYQQFSPTYFTRPKDTTLTAGQAKRCIENFTILMKYAKMMNDKGIEIRLGSDMPDGGKADISELLLLADHGFSAADIFKITTYNGAKAMGIADEVGTIEKDMAASLLIWDNDPFENTRNFNTTKTIIKNGRILKSAGNHLPAADK